MCGLKEIFNVISNAYNSYNNLSTYYTMGKMCIRDRDRLRTGADISSYHISEEISGQPALTGIDQSETVVYLFFCLL